MYCDFFGCIEPIREEDLYIEEGLKFCEDHGSKCEEIVSRLEDDENAIRELLGFWFKSQGRA